MRHMLLVAAVENASGPRGDWCRGNWLVLNFGPIHHCIATDIEQMNECHQLLPRRVADFRRAMLQGIPPLHGAEQELAKLNLSQALMVYVNWAHRFIRPRRRSVEFSPGFWHSEAAKDHGGEVLALASQIALGSDLGPFLSRRVLIEGFSSRSGGDSRRRGPDWADKDFALNAYGIHHLHLAPITKSKRRATPGKHGPLLYAEFSRASAFLLMVGDHKSFDDGTLDAAVIEARAASGSFDLIGLRPPRRDEDVKAGLRLARHGMATSGAKDGRVIMGALLSTAGTSIWHTRHADKMHYVLGEVDPKLDDPVFVSKLFNDAHLEIPPNADFVWNVEYTELSVIEVNSATKFIMVEGLN